MTEMLKQVQHDVNDNFCDTCLKRHPELPARHRSDGVSGSSKIIKQNLPLAAELKYKYQQLLELFGK